MIWRNSNHGHTCSLAYLLDEVAGDRKKNYGQETVQVISFCLTEWHSRRQPLFRGGEYWIVTSLRFFYIINEVRITESYLYSDQS